MPAAKGLVMRVGFLVTARRLPEVVFSLFLPPAEGRPPLGTFARSSMGCAAFIGQLFYQTELLSQCGAASPEQTQSPAALALLAYERLGVSGLEQMEG